MAKKRGWEGVLYHGAYGSQAATQLLTVVDLEYDCGVEFMQTTVRGDGTAIPIQDNEPAELQPKITFTLLRNVGSDTSLATLIAAAKNTTPTPVAIYLKDYSSGKGFDGDCYLKVKNGLPMKGTPTFDFEAVPTTAGGRAPLLNAS
jgi:hypothetical protein